MTLVGNPEPLVDKTFTNLEFRANVDTEGTTNTAFTPYLPFDNLEVWNEYQHGITDLENKHGHSAMVHHSSDMTSALKRKFRIWRCDIPRDNYPLSGNQDVDVEKGIYRYSRKPMDRIRNPWAYLKLQKEENTNKRVEIHDVTMTYFS